MTTTRRGFVALAALALAWTLPLGAVAQEDDTTTTTVEIEISATSITSTTEGTQEAVTGASGGSSGPDDTLPFTGSSPQEMAKVAYLALGAGVVLLAMARRRPGGAGSD